MQQPRNGAALAGSPVTVHQAVILLGGLDSRAGAPDADTDTDADAPLLPCGDRPILAWLMRELLRFGVTEFVLLAGGPSPLLGSMLPGIVARLPRPVTVTCPVVPARAGTGGALLHAAERLDARFLVCRGDAAWDCNLSPLLADAAANPALGRMVLRKADADRHGVVSLDGDQGLADAGIYLLDRAVVPLLTPGCSLDAEVLPALAAMGELRTTVATGTFHGLGDPAERARAQATLPGRLHRPALLLDRDGTINRDHGWVGTWDRWEWVDGAREAIALATMAGWHVFVVTNQSGVARGYYDEAAVGTLHAAMTNEVRRAGGTIDDIRFCPFHEAASVPRYRRASDWRKPAPGMILDLIDHWGLDPARCVLVGDQPSDMAAAAAAGIRGRLFDGIDLRHTVVPLLGLPRGAFLSHEDH